MLGSDQDAEDALQEALLRAWRGLPRFDGRSSLRGWLYRIVTNACRDEIERRSRRVVPVGHGPQEEPAPEGGGAAPEARCEQREGAELALAAALHLPARQREVLILCEVLGFSAQEASDSLGTTVASVNSALQRARAALVERRPERSRRSLGEVRDIAAGFVDAFERGDVGAILAFVAGGATFGRRVPAMS